MCLDYNVGGGMISPGNTGGCGITMPRRGIIMQCPDLLNKGWVLYYNVNDGHHHVMRGGCLGMRSFFGKYSKFYAYVKDLYNKSGFTPYFRGIFTTFDARSNC